jgi:hypothetical protein
MRKLETKYITTVIQDGDDLIMPFPDTLMENMGWKEGDVLEWTIHDNHASIRKVEDSENIMRKFEGQNETSSTE